MIDDFALAVAHLLLALAFWRLALRDELDCDPPREGDEAGDSPGA